jgi:hypothetical protein
MAFVFWGIFDPGKMSYGFKQMGNNIDSPFTWLLLTTIVVRPLLSGAVMFITLKLFGVKIKYRDIFVAAYLASFIGAVSITFIAGPAFML